MDRDDIQYEVEEIMKDIVELDGLDSGYGELMDITDILNEKFNGEEEMPRVEIIKVIKQYFKKRDKVDLNIV